MNRSQGRLLFVAVAALTTSSCTVASHHDAKDLLVTNWSSSDISAFRLRDDGSLAGQPRLTKVAKKTANPQGSIRSRDNRRLYVADWGSGTVTSYKISASGQLKDPLTVTASRAVHPSGLALSPDSRNLYVADDGNGKRGSVAHLKLDPDGRPEPVSSVDSGGDGTTSVTVTPDGRTLLASNPGTGTISSFALSDDGSPTFVTTTASGRGTFFTAVGGDGQLVVASNAGEDTLTLFRLKPGSRLERVATTAAGAHEPRGIVVDGKGRRAYVANFNGGKGAGAVTTFAIEPSGLKLLTAAAATGSAGSEGIALSSDARALYVANFNTDGDGSITSFPVSSDGLLGPPREPVETGGRQPDLTSITLAP